ncbi:MAG: hypothetical protein GWO20_11540 [Candidatus Korarchaeota archaeon]|nr:hypothetical protein [Candidatus Korarchaeota archaeon]NIU84076.1 hypothetical protein [Candidatus Thorarchaeota archaeon]NIW13404.1 hypothetical protein [Candidatus Thorarchaeota archaeon]NIW51529.1 hypothetical protein [Candidatus Korarchaeota archaeon]
MDRLEAYSRKVRISIIIFKILSFIMFLLLLYSLSPILSNLLQLEHLVFLLRLFKAVTIYLVSTFFEIVFLLGGKRNVHNVILRLLRSIFLFSGEVPSLNFTTILQELDALTSGIVILLMVIVSLYGVGFIKTGEYEYVLWSFLLVLVVLLLGITFTPFQLSIPDFEIGNISDILFSPLFVFLITLYFFLVVGQQLSYFSSVLVPISKRAKRINSRIEMMEKLGEVEREERISERIRNEEKSLIEQLSSLSTTSLKDAYKGYSFAGRSTYYFSSSKLKSFIEAEKERKPDLLESLAGQSSLPSLKKYLFLSFCSFILELSLAFPIGIFALIAPRLMQASSFFSDVFIVGEYEFTVFIIFSSSLAFLLLIEALDSLLKKRGAGN